MNARTGSLPHDLAGSLSPEQMKVWWAELALQGSQQAREQQRKADEQKGAKA